MKSTSPEQLRTTLTARLVAKQRIRTPAVEAAFRTVPRHLFVPEHVTAAQAYADDIVATKHGPDGKTTSSVSALWLTLSTPAVQWSGRYWLDTSVACRL